jgi:acyl-[acyl-carrier-protein] desaturase
MSQDSADVPAAALSMRRATAHAVRRCAARAWSLEDVSWNKVRPDDLTADDRSIVQLITYVEDHIPSYLSFLLSAFPTTGDLDVVTYVQNRSYAGFLIAWAYDEEKHAAALTRYQICAGMADEEKLLKQLADAGRKPWGLPYEDPLELYVYAFLQEKATQLFYQRYQRVVREPLLKELLARLAMDEARHFGLYAKLVENCLKEAGPEALMGVKNVLGSFRMPLDGLLDGYWRMALAAVDTVQHDHTEAYNAIGRLVRGFSGSFGTPEVEDLMNVIGQVQRMP